MFHYGTNIPDWFNVFNKFDKYSGHKNRSIQNSFVDKLSKTNPVG